MSTILLQSFIKKLSAQVQHERKAAMKKIKDTRFYRIVGGKGLYITLAACIIAIGGAGVAAYNKAIDKINEDLTFSIPDTASTAERQADQKKDDVAKDESSSTADSSEADEKMTTQPNVMPVNGEILKPFSNGELVRSETLNVWKTHDGVDISAEAGTQVKAMNRGEVTKVWDDPLWGSCISIDHGDGIVGYYYNLSAAITVEEGDEVVSGQVIGAVGDTAEIEAAERSHLHFGLKRNDKWIDPITFIDPNSNK